MLYTYSEMSGGADNSRLVTMTYPDGYELTLNYSSGLNDTISRLSSLSDSTGTLEAYKYLGVDTVVERDHPLSGVNETLISQTGATGDAGDQYVGLDRFGRVDDVLWLNAATGATTDEFQEGFDPDNNVLFQNNTVDPALSELDTYTGENELATYAQGTLNSTHTALTGTASASQSYVTNGVGDFTSITTNGTTQTQTANAQNEVTGVSGATTPTYDANGNMTTDQNGNQLVYDAWNRLVAVLNSSGTTLETMSYDGLNRLITQTIGGTTTDRDFSSQDQLLEEMVGGAATARYVWSPVYVNAMILRDAATGTAGTLNQRLWVQQDANWNVTALVNGSGAVVERYVYSPFGTVTIYNASYTSTLTSSAYNWVYGFQGMRFDALSGLNESQSRWYSPALQRWTTVDPSGFGGGDVDLYRFVGNNPTGATDPTGLDAYDWIARQIGPSNVLAVDRVLGNQQTGWFAQTSNGAAGWADGVSGGATNYIRNWMGTNDVVDKNSTAYGVGYVGGTINGIALSFANPCALATRAPLLASGLRGLSALQAAGQGGQAFENLSQGNYGSAALNGLGMFGSLGSLFRACFVRGTPVLTPDGWKVIEDLVPGDEVWSRSERDVAAPVEARRALQTFVRESPVLNLHVRGRIIGTTGEHPFWVAGKGWTAARELRIGDVLVSHDGQQVQVEGVADSGRIETVYNVEVEDDHTYFVGCPEWGFSIWTHNVGGCGVLQGNRFGAAVWRFWDKGTFFRKSDTLWYHYNAQVLRRGLQMSVREYTEAALAFLKQYGNNSRYTQFVQRADGTGQAIRITVNDRVGIYSLAGRILTFHP